MISWLFFDRGNFLKIMVTPFKIWVNFWSWLPYFSKDKGRIFNDPRLFFPSTFYSKIKAPFSNFSRSHFRQKSLSDTRSSNSLSKTKINTTFCGAFLISRLFFDRDTHSQSSSSRRFFKIDDLALATPFIFSLAFSLFALYKNQPHFLLNPHETQKPPQNLTTNKNQKSTTYTTLPHPPFYKLYNPS